MGVMIATTLFAASNIGGNSMMVAMLYDILEDVAVDLTWQVSTYRYREIYNRSDFFSMRQIIEGYSEVTRSELFIRSYEHHLIDATKPLEEQLILTSGIQHNSTVYDGMTLISGTMNLEANQTLLTASSAQAANYPVGSNYSIGVRIWEDTGTDIDMTIIYNLTLEVVGHVELTSQAQDLLKYETPYPGYQPSWYQHYFSFFLVDVESTFLPIFDHAATDPEVVFTDLDQFIFIFVDRVTSINPYNVQLSAQELQQLAYRIENSLSSQGYYGSFLPPLVWTLNFFVSISENFRVVFLQVSIPVFFIALYMGITLNDVSYSIRRREVGLLLTKGVTRSTITSLFVWEALLIGLVASLLGIVLTIFLIPFFISTVTWASIIATGIGLDTIFLTIMFGVFLAVIASYLPARKASKIPTTEAIREYSTVGETLSYPRMLAWTALILGSYKLVIWLLGINVTEIVLQLRFTNPFLASFASFWLLFDALITFWVPLLFLWGLVTIIVKGWKGFYTYSQRFISRVLGELGGLASLNIRRRLGRTAAIIFITALLIGYSVQSIGILGTSLDLAVRDAYTTVGADLNVRVSAPENVTDLLSTIRAIDGVSGAAGQYRFTIAGVGILNVRAINVSEWLGVAYWEPDWISGLSSLAAFEQLAAANRTIILEKRHAVELGVDLGDNISVQFSDSDSYHNLTVVSYMGPDPILNPYPWVSEWLAEETWSYVPVELMEEFSNELTPTGHVLVALDSPIDNTAVVEAIEALDDVLRVESAITDIEEYNSNAVLSSTTNMMQLGVICAFLLASVGTLVIIYLTLRERRTITALMSARGMTYSQTVIILLAEIFTIIVFAIFIGFIVGLIIYNGFVSGGTANIVPPLLSARFLPPEFLGMFLLQTGLIIGMLLLATFIPIFIEARVARYDLSVLR